MDEVWLIVSIAIVLQISSYAVFRGCGNEDSPYEVTAARILCETLITVESPLPYVPIAVPTPRHYLSSLGPWRGVLGVINLSHCCARWLPPWA